MLFSLSYYYKKCLDSGIESMDCNINAYLRNPISGKTKHWPEVKTYYDYINKCYAIAQEFPVEELRNEYQEAKFQGKKALEQVHLKVVDSLNLLNERDLNYMMGYTPISHVREQLISLSDEIYASLRSCNQTPRSFSQKAVPAKRSLFSMLFG